MPALAVPNEVHLGRTGARDDVPHLRQQLLATHLGGLERRHARHVHVGTMRLQGLDDARPVGQRPHVVETHHAVGQDDGVAGAGVFVQGLGQGAGLGQGLEGQPPPGDRQQGRGAQHAQPTHHPQGHTTQGHHHLHPLNDAHHRDGIKKADQEMPRPACARVTRGARSLNARRQATTWASLPLAYRAAMSTMVIALILPA